MDAKIEKLKLLAKAYKYAVEYDKIPDLSEFENEGEDISEDPNYEEVKDLQEWAGYDEGEITWAIIDAIEDL